jgi:RHH-type rel operon transcriptional repressor/antitoxin RelB
MYSIVYTSNTWYALSYSGGKIMKAHPITVRMQPDLEARLDQVAKAADRSRSYIIKKAIQQYLEDIEDVRLVEQRMKNPETISVEEAFRGLDD